MELKRYYLEIHRLDIMNPPSRGLSHSVMRGGGHWPHVHDAGALSQAVWGQMGQSEGRQTPNTKALMFPGQHVVCKVNLFVDHGKLDIRVLTGNHLKETDVSSLWIEWYVSNIYWITAKYFEICSWFMSIILPCFFTPNVLLFLFVIYLYITMGQSCDMETVSSLSGKKITKGAKLFSFP